jgi:hypothetical protein
MTAFIPNSLFKATAQVSNTAAKATVKAEAAVSLPRRYWASFLGDTRLIYQTIPGLQGSGGATRSDRLGQGGRGGTKNTMADRAPSRSGLQDSFYQRRKFDMSGALAKANSWKL